MLNTDALARSAYANATAIAPQPRDNEYRAFAEATRRITDHAGRSDRFPQLAEAIYRNQKLWVMMAAGVADEANGLPPALRAQIFYLAEFVRTHSAKVLQETATPDILVEINTMMMRGLRPTAGAAA
ncbi:flagellar biosynthesis regulator FlaF [Rhodobacteraceae bacterium 2CG4]|uniref:Flagellar biosynthesis regulator FlaF n=1 Tax=Halovulum marinum TaxID=2662447 RepID=A0A6L5Z5E8_9RHOB|nr:flagellar biosynthesis regulator FlaF [Halovulum marinum]MSU91791.1 flagellar biosynthesis regulator FlaF [Halovulum marinum]